MPAYYHEAFLPHSPFSLLMRQLWLVSVHLSVSVRPPVVLSEPAQFTTLWKSSWINPIISTLKVDTQCLWHNSGYSGVSRHDTKINSLLYSASNAYMWQSSISMHFYITVMYKNTILQAMPTCQVWGCTNFSTEFILNKLFKIQNTYRMFYMTNK